MPNIEVADVFSMCEPIKAKYRMSHGMISFLSAQSNEGAIEK